MADENERLMADPKSLGFIGIAASDFDRNVQGNMPCGALVAVFHGMRHGADQTDAVLSKSGVLNVNGMAHHPLLVFEGDPKAHTIRVRVVRMYRAAARLPRDTPIMLQWPGKYRSDWFQFTAGELADHLARLDDATAPESAETATESP